MQKSDLQNTENFDLKELGQYIKHALFDHLLNTNISLDELVITVRLDSIVKVLTFLRDDPNCQFRQLIDICGSDFPEQTNRFCIVYNLLSLVHNCRVRIKLWTNEETQVPSVVEIFNSANWYEREVWDLFGIFFSNHPDLRRLLNDYGFDGHPLRKDFPLTGYVEVRYDDEQKRVVYEPVKLTQDFRVFDFLSPWEGLSPHEQKNKEIDSSSTDSN